MISLNQNRKINFGCLLVGLALLQACTQKTDPTPAVVQPKALNEVLAHESPLSLYVDTYGTFRFTSYSVLTMPDTGATKLEGRTLFERDTRGNYHLTRVPLMNQPPLELFHFNQKAFLRFGTEADFRPIDHQPEFDRWANKSFREVFALYQKSGFTGQEDGTSKGNLLCRTHGEGTVCTDPASGLPVSGAIRVRLESGSLESRFSLAPADSRPVVILPPTPGTRQEPAAVQDGGPRKPKPSRKKR